MNKIVYVEDDSEVGTLIAAWLGKHDFKVIVEPRGDRALEVIEAHAPDLLLLDILLPGKDGMTLCRDLRPRYAGPIVLLTSLNSDMNHVLALEMGANDYILNTTPPAVLLARVRLHLRQNSGAARACVPRRRVVLNLTAFDLPRWLGEKIEDMRILHPERAIAPEVPAGGDFGPLDERLTERVLDNLVNNALRYSRQSISIRLGQQGDWGYLQVDDDGPGIPTAERERIFEPLSAWIQAAIAPPAAAAWGWPSFTSSPMAARVASAKAIWAAPVFCSAGRSNRRPLTHRVSLPALFWGCVVGSVALDEG